MFETLFKFIKWMETNENAFKVFVFLVFLFVFLAILL